MTGPVVKPAGAARDGVLRAVMGVMLALSAALWLWDGEGRVREAASPDLPTPWVSDPVRCPTGSDDSTRMQALAREAETLWQRAYFDWSDGPRAIERLLQATACARSAGNLRAVDRYAARAAEWKQHVQRLQDREALRLELAERQQDAEAMQRHAGRLQALLESGEPQRVGEARGWLGRTQRRARALHATEREEDEDE